MKTLEITKSGETTTTEFAHPSDASHAMHVARNAAVRDGYRLWAGLSDETKKHSIFVRPLDRAVVSIKLT